jgi:hypothetical protein
MDIPLDEIRRIAALFCIPEPSEVVDFPEKGNINRRAYLINTNPAGKQGQYILQQLNLEVLTQPLQLMRSVIACIQAQHRALSQGILKPGQDWEVMTIMPTRAGSDYLEIQGEDGLECWRVMVRIPNCRAYQSLNQITDPLRRFKIAEQAGCGLALFGGLTAGMDLDQMMTPVPGYRNTKFYYDQLFSILKGSRTLEDAATFLPLDLNLRRNTESLFLVDLPTQEYRRRLEDEDVRRCIRLAAEQQGFASSLFSDFQQGALGKTVIHGDPKLENFLFEIGSDEVRSLIDLDTIMPYTWLADWGDMVRSLINKAGEKPISPDLITVDMEIFEAAARGFLYSARRTNSCERYRMVDAVQIMVLELGVRFLTDYLRGDTYFKLDPRQPADLNKMRALVQFTLFKKIRAQSAPASRIIENLCREYGISTSHESAFQNETL